MKTERGLTELDGVGLAWTRSGPRSKNVPPVVLAHGLTDAAATWDRVASPLSRTRDVIRYDARGHGGSSWAGDYSVESNTADLVGLVRHLRLDRPVLIGHSMGAVHAALATAELDVTALVLEDPHWPEVAEDGTKDLSASRRSVVEVAALSSAERHAHVRSEHPTWAEDDLNAWALARGHLDPDVVNWFGSWQTTNRWREHVAHLRRPTLLVTGDVKPSVTPRAAAEAQQLCSRLQAVQIRRAGHNVRRDQYKSYWQYLTSFLTYVSSRGLRLDRARQSTLAQSTLTRTQSPEADRSAEQVLWAWRTGCCAANSTRPAGLRQMCGAQRGTRSRARVALDDPDPAVGVATRALRRRSPTAVEETTTRTHISKPPGDALANA